MTINLTIDGRPVEVAPGQSVLDAARKLGIDVPTLCYLDCLPPNTSCLVCLVKQKVNGQERLIPSCGTRAQPGMVIESEAPDVHEARRTALELLLSDHVGDCLSPCHRICPLQLNIPQMIRQIEANRLDEAIATIKEALALPAILGRLCHRPCENGCRRGTWDQPAAIRDLERFAADHDLRVSSPHRPACRPATGKRVAVIGAGPAGLAAAYWLHRQGHAVTVVDRHETAGGSLRAAVQANQLPAEVLAAELRELERLGIAFKPGLELGDQLTLEGLFRGFDAVLLALGESGKGAAAKLGLATAPAGLKVNPDTAETSVPGVFAAGSLVKPARQLVRAMSEGQTAAMCLARFLAGEPPRKPAKPFSSMMGRVDPEELKAFLVGPRLDPRVTPACGAHAGFSDAEAGTEAGRCLHCDCRAAGNCALQHYAELYGAEANHFRADRRRFEQHEQPGGVLFEPGKCILCGICVQLAERAREPLGLTFVGRGFDVRVAVPLNGTFETGLQQVAAECVQHCPTGALAFRGGKRTAPTPCHGCVPTAARPADV